MSKKNFRKVGQLTLRSSVDGRDTLYSAITVDHYEIIQAIKRASRRSNRTPAKILKRYIERAFESGIVLD